MHSTGPIRIGPTKRPKRKSRWKLLLAVCVVIVAGVLFAAHEDHKPGLTLAEADELAAIQSLHSIYQSQSQYQTNFPGYGFACSMSALGGDPNSGPPTPQAAQVLPGDLPTGQEAGYIFTIAHCRKAPGNPNLVTSYEVFAVPQTAGKTGRRGFCMDQTGQIQFDPAGGAHCTQPLNSGLGQD